MDLRGLFAPRFEARQRADRAEARLLASLRELPDERHAAVWVYARYLRRAATPLRSGGGSLMPEARAGLEAH